MEFIKRFFKGKTIALYIALGVALMSIIMAIVYAAIFAKTDYMSWLAFALLLAAPVAFIALSIFNFSRLGAAVMAGLDFVAILLLIRYGYQYVMDFFINGFTSEFTAIAVMLVLMFVTFISGNVVAWLRHQKRDNAAVVTEG